VTITNPDGTTSRLAVPEQKYADANVGSCSGVPESDRSDKPAYVRATNFTPAQAQLMCQSQLRAIMTADDEFDKTMQLLADRGVLANTLVVFSSDNGYNWGEHGRTEKFVPYEPSIRVPLLVRWPGHFAAGTNTSHLASYVDILPTLLEAAGVALRGSAPPLDGESLLHPSTRTTMYSEYYKDSANGPVPPWRMVRSTHGKYIQTYEQTGAVIFREYYNLTSDPAENINLLADGNSANDPPQTEINALTAQLNSFRTCSGGGCVK
jgi:arylsulfatase A-like enzyme